MGRHDGFDIAIVGAGAAGCVLARRLAERGDRTVVLLEAGPDLRDDAPPGARDGWRLPTVPDWGFRSEPEAGGTSQPLRRGRLIGGTSWLTRFAVRGSAAGFDAWAAGARPGWAFADVLPAFRRVERDAEYGDRPWHGADGLLPITRYLEHPVSAVHAAALAAFDALGYPPVDDHNEPGAVGVGPIPMSSHDGERVTSADAYLPVTWTSPALTIRPDAPVDRVELASGRATGVRLADGTAIRADAVILAAGTYGSPAILMRSGVGPADHLRELGIEVRIDLTGVGGNLADHPGVDLDAGWRGEAAGGAVRQSIATLRSAGTAADAGPDLMFWLSDPDGAEAGFYLDPILLRPRSRGTVRLRSADPTDPPRIELPGLREPSDIDRLVEGYERGLELANHPAIRRACSGPAPSAPTTPAAWRERVLENAYSIPHVVGTCAMGPVAADGAVVDIDGQVHGVAGLLVADASIMPEPPDGFPHLVTLMLAEHLSARLADRGG